MTDWTSEQWGVFWNRVLIVALSVVLALLFCCGQDWI